MMRTIMLEEEGNRFDKLIDEKKKQKKLTSQVERQLR
jgi:hypothetical protein